MSNILITAIGSFSADIVIKNLKKYGYKVIGIDINQKELIADAYNIDKFYKSPYANQEKEYINFLVELIRNEQIEYIIPLTDFEIDVINKHREEIDQCNCVICIADEDVINICRNKKKTYDYLYSRQIDECIPTLLLSEINDYNKLMFPLVLKPYDGRSSQGLIYVKNCEDLIVTVEKIDKSKYICQPKIDGIIVTVDVLRNPNTKEVISIARKELLRTLNGAGTSVYVYNDSNLDSIVKKIADALDIKGCVNFEFIYNEEKEKYYFIECNPRFSGGVEFSCIASYDMVINHLNIFKKVNIDKVNKFKNQYIVRKYEEYVTKIDS